VTAQRLGLFFNLATLAVAIVVLYLVFTTSEQNARLEAEVRSVTSAVDGVPYGPAGMKDLLVGIQRSVDALGDEIGHEQGGYFGTETLHERIDSVRVSVRELSEKLDTICRRALISC